MAGNLRNICYDKMENRVQFLIYEQNNYSYSLYFTTTCELKILYFHIKFVLLFVGICD